MGAVWRPSKGALAHLGSNARTAALEKLPSKAQITCCSLAMRCAWRRAVAVAAASLHGAACHAAGCRRRARRQGYPRAAALREYGVALTEDGTVDPAETERRRYQMAAANTTPETYDRGEPD